MTVLFNASSPLKGAFSRYGGVMTDDGPSWGTGVFSPPHARDGGSVGMDCLRRKDDRPAFIADESARPSRLWGMADNC